MSWETILDRCESPIERDLAELFRWRWPDADPSTGFCTPERMRAAELRRVRLVFCQYPVERFRADFLIVQGGSAPLVVECDGWAYHQGDPSTWQRDADRDAVMRAAGFETLRFPGSRIRKHGDQVVAIIERALRGEFRVSA